MTTTINADNGVVSGSAGLKSSADSSGVLALQTNGTTAISIDASQAVSFTNAPTVTGGTANGVAYLNGSKVLTTSTALVFNSSNNLGLGVTPTSGWATFTNVFENQGGAIACSGVNNIRVFQNSYYNGSNYIYKTTEAASRYDQQQGVHAWFNAASGTAGNAITFTQAMTLDASGNLLVGTTTAGAKFTLQYDGGVVVGQNINDSANTTNSTLMQFLIQGTQVGTIKRVGATSAVVYNTTSDYRLKTVVGAVTGQGDRIDALKPVNYLWKEGNTSARGFLAHEFKEVYANSVSGDKDAVDANGNPVYQAMQASTSEVIADLVAEIQSLRKRLAALESA